MKTNEKHIFHRSTSTSRSLSSEWHLRPVSSPGAENRPEQACLCLGVACYESALCSVWICAGVSVWIWGVLGQLRDLHTLTPDIYRLQSTAHSSTCRGSRSWLQSSSLFLSHIQAALLAWKTLHQYCQSINVYNIHCNKIINNNK